MGGVEESGGAVRRSLRIPGPIISGGEGRAKRVVEVEKAIGIGCQVGETGFPRAQDVRGAINKIQLAGSTRKEDMENAVRDFRPHGADRCVADGQNGDGTGDGAEKVGDDDAVNSGVRRLDIGEG